MAKTPLQKPNKTSDRKKHSYRPKDPERPASTRDSVINLPVVTLLKFSDRCPDLHDHPVTGARCCEA